MAATDTARVRRAVEWLIRNPVELEIVEALAELETASLPRITDADRDAAHRYLHASRLGRCALCFTQVAYWPDGRSLDFPSLERHRCPKDSING